MNWLREHRLALAAAIARIRKMPGSFGFNILVIALALILPLAGMTLLENLRPISRDLAVEPEISVFLWSEMEPERIEAIGRDIRAAARRAGLSAKLQFVDRDSALKAMKARASLGDVVDVLGSNPLPDAYIVRVADGGGHSGAAADPARIEQLAGALKKVDGVEAVQLDAAWMKRLVALLNLASTALLLLAITLGGVVLAVVFNTIRLQVVTQQEEISVMRLLGATDAFVSRPFYYMGGLLGLCAGAFALLTLAGGLVLLNVSVGELASLYGSSFTLAPLDLSSVVILLAASTALGVVGAVLSVQRALRVPG